MKVVYYNENQILENIRLSAITGGLPMMVDVPDFTAPLKEKDINRIVKLGNTLLGSGHSNLLKGIVVNCVIEAPQYWWLQFGRYHFQDIISSQSKMHRITHMDLKKQCNKWVDDRTIEVLNEYISAYNDALEDGNSGAAKDLFHLVVSNIPMGLNLTAGVTTNYLQLKTMYYQRKNHKLDDWSSDFISWVEELPYFKQFCLQKKGEK